MKVIIEIHGGVADCTYKDKGVEVHIIDHDNQNGEEDNWILAEDILIDELD